MLKRCPRLEELRDKPELFDELDLDVRIEVVKMVAGKIAEEGVQPYRRLIAHICRTSDELCMLLIYSIPEDRRLKIYKQLREVKELYEAVDRVATAEEKYGVRS